tara:strand:- start:5315 stop:5482 length:168 start_codon:yes stop_codon:yes gene_type:complete
MASQKKATKKEVEKQESNEQFIKLAQDLKEIMLDLNQRVSEIESLFERIRTRLGL